MDDPAVVEGVDEGSVPDRHVNGGDPLPEPEPVDDDAADSTQGDDD